MLELSTQLKESYAAKLKNEIQNLQLQKENNMVRIFIFLVELGIKRIFKRYLNLQKKSN